MEIGSKIKAARNKAGITQEKAADELGVTRQTISNWENNRSYPDIVSVVKMSDLYSVSLDHLLKEDKDIKTSYLDHLEESTNVVKSNNRKTRILLVSVYLIVWIVAIAVFWIPHWISGSGAVDAMGFSLMTFYVALPVTTIVTSFFIGKDHSWGISKWLMLLFYGIMFSLAEYVTFGLCNMIFNEYAKTNYPEIGMVLTGAVMAAIGIGAGILVSHLQTKSNAKRKEDT